MEYFFELKLKDCNKIFEKGMGPGVVASQTVEIVPHVIGESLVTSSSMIVKALLDEENSFLNKHIEIMISQK